jgi:hypothetical protein
MAIKSFLPLRVATSILIVAAFFLGRFTASWPKKEIPRTPENSHPGSTSTAKIIIPSDQHVIGYLDMVQGKPVILARQESDVQLSGWAACVDADSRLIKVGILVDDKFQTETTPSYPRSDVAAAYGRPDFESGGWKASFSTRGMETGDHSLRASLTCSKGEVGLLPAFTLSITHD